MIKKIISLAIIALFLNVNQSFSQDKKTKAKEIKTDTTSAQSKEIKKTVPVNKKDCKLEQEKDK